MKKAAEKSARVLGDNVALPRLKDDGPLVLSARAVLGEMT